MKYNDKNPITLANPAELDHMPVEVATAFLTEPRARITARHRKLCKQAREKVFLSTSPIIACNNTKHDVREFHYSGIAPKLAEVKLVEKAKRASIAQLGKWRQRCANRRRSIQATYQKLEAVSTEGMTPFKQRMRERTLQLLSARAAILDLAWDAFDTEIKHRGRK